MHLWTIQNYKKHYDIENTRQGLRVRYDQDIIDEVRESIVKFIGWLRDNYNFPIRVKLYIKSNKYIVAKDGERVAGVFRSYDDNNEEPYIKIATGDYATDKNEWGRDDALATILGTIAHELTHYYQWLNQTSQTNRGAEHQASLYAKWILYEYSQFTEHP